MQISPRPLFEKGEVYWLILYNLGIKFLFLCPFTKQTNLISIKYKLQ